LILLKKFTAAQYALLFSAVLEFVQQVKAKYDIGTKSFLEGKTWQELYMYDKAFAPKSH